MPDTWASDRILRPGNERRRQQIMARNERLRKQREKKDDGIFGGFLSAAGKVIDTAGKGLDLVRPSSAVVPRASTSGRLRTAGVRGATRGDYARFAGEQSGVLPAYRIRQGKGSTWDWIAVASMGAGPGVRTAVGAARQPVKFGIMSDDLIGKIINKGSANIKTKNNLRFPGDTNPIHGRSVDIEDMVRELPEFNPDRLRHLPQVYRVPKKAGPYRSQDVGYANRTPFLTDLEKGDVYFGGFGQSHGNIKENLAAIGDQFDFPWNRVQQGHLIQPVDELMMMDLGWGPLWGRPAPAKTFGLQKMFERMFKNYDDADFIGFDEPRGPVHLGDAGMERLMNVLNTHPSPRGGVDPADFESWARQEKMRRRRR